MSERGAVLVGGVEAGGAKFVCAVGSGPDDVRALVRIPTTSPGETIARAIAFFDEQLRVVSIAAIGIASFGPLDLQPGSPTRGFITTTPKPGWAQTDVAGSLRARFGVPVAVDTDVNGAALAEHRWGAARGCDPVVYVTVGTGIGAGVLVGGRPVHGLVHPEMGHMRVPRDASDRYGGACPWHRDCLEGLASGPAIAARWNAAPETLPGTHPAWEMEARYLALGLVNVIAVLSPERLVVGGGVMGQAHLYGRVRVKVRELLAGYLSAPSVLDAIDAYILPPGLGEDAGVLGALALAHDALDGVAG